MITSKVIFRKGDGKEAAAGLKEAGQEMVDDAQKLHIYGFSPFYTVWLFLVYFTNEAYNKKVLN